MEVNRLHRTGPALLLVVLAAVAAACVPPTPAPAPTPTTAGPAPTVPTTTAPTTSTVPALTCDEYLQDFAADANAGTYTSPALTVSVQTLVSDGSGYLDGLDNPTGTSQPATASQQIQLGFTTYDGEGDVVVPSPSQPLVVNVYGGGTAVTTADSVGASTDPLTLVLTSGAPITLDYDGSFLPAPLTVQAAMQLDTSNICTDTASWSIGATTVPLLNAVTEDGSDAATLPAACDDVGTDDGDCPEETIQTTGIRLRAAVGYAAGWPTDATGPSLAPPVAEDFDSYTVDTGSIGAAVPVEELGPNVVGPAGPAYKFYDSSGYEYTGFLYLAQVTIRDSSLQTVSSIPIRVLGVVSSGCVAGYSCTSAPDPEAFHYLGVGFDRNTPSPADQLASPTDNALLQLRPDDPTYHFAPGYIVDGSGVEVGLTAGQVSGFATADLTGSTDVPGDWLTAPGFVAVDASIDDVSGEPSTPASVLVDTGITEMFVDSASRAAPFDHLTQDDYVSVSVGNSPGTTAFSPYFFQVGAGGVPSQEGMNPSHVSLIHLQTSGIFVNTGRYVLFENRYMFDARKGAVGFSALSTPRPT